ncbi:hypothetical protein DL764_001452 [Monosporascus ibericus]|uniref:Uncharacterized protein n=1 Tax=Monosporascus ibericus TaxID=155417 RepID=A0A4Q4TPH6_9PEZI|nr:hypothetical protein DL764_001452 [Monosporascus ibericus]
MDPLEFAASVAGIVIFSAEVSLLVGRCIEEIHGVPQSLNLLNDTLQTLRTTLEQIGEVVKDGILDSGKQHFKIIEKISNDCYKLLLSLQKDLSGLQREPGLLRRLVAAFELKLKERGTKEKLDAIQHYTASLNLSLGALSFQKLSHLDSNVNEMMEKIDALAAPRQSLLDDSSQTLAAPYSNPARPEISKMNTDITETYRQNILAWRESIVNVTRESSICHSAATSDVGTLPSWGVRTYSVTTELHKEALSISEEKVKEWTAKGVFFKAALEQKESIKYRKKLSDSRPFPFEEEAAMEEARADLLLRCVTVARWQEAMTILENLLWREEALAEEYKSPERQGRLCLKLGCLLAHPERVGRKSDLASAKYYLKEAMVILGHLEAPPDEDLMKAHRLLVRILISGGHITEAEAHERWMTKRQESVVSVASSDVPNSARSFSSEETSPPSMISIRSSYEYKSIETDGPSKALEWARVAKILLSCGASVDVRDSSGRTVLHRCQIGDMHSGVTTAEFFLGADPSLLDSRDNEGRTALLMAVENNHRRMTEMLLTRGADPNMPDRYGKTCLHLAVEACGSDSSTSVRSLSIVKLLLKHRANPNARDNTDKRPLYLACHLGNSKLINELLNAGADVNGRGVLDETPLIVAVRHHHVPVVKKLVTRGAHSTLRDKYGRDAFSYATGPRRLELLRALHGSRI